MRTLLPQTVMQDRGHGEADRRIEHVPRGFTEDERGAFDWTPLDDSGGLQTRRTSGRARTAPLVRVPRTLPRILAPGEVDALLSALRTTRDRGMVFRRVASLRSARTALQ